MKKRILCAIMSAVMVVGMMTGCGSSSEDTSSKSSGVTKKVEVEDSVLTKLTPGKSTKEDVEEFLDDNNFTYGEASDHINVKNTGLFLGYEYCPETIYFSTEENSERTLLHHMTLKVWFKNVEDYTKGADDIADYLSALSTGVTATKKANGYKFNMYLMDDEDDFMICSQSNSKTYEDGIGDYYDTGYDTGIEIFYGIDRGSYFFGRDIEWKDSDGNKYIPKVYKWIENADTTESVYSTESVH